MAPTGTADRSTVDLSTDLDAPAEVVWAAVRTPQAFRAVTRGLLDWRPLRGRTERWREGDEATGWLLLGGVVPFSRHRIRIEALDDERRILRSDESGGLLRSWRHDITVEPLADGRSRYRDVVRIDAGPLTPVVTAIARRFYRERQRRWRHLAGVLDAAERSRLDHARGWLHRHEAAFNSGDVAGLTADYTDDVVLEAHVGGTRLDLTGDDVAEALATATSAGDVTRVRRVAVSADVVAAQIDDDAGRPYMVSFWELRDGRIARDVSILLDRPG